MASNRRVRREKRKNENNMPSKRPRTRSISMKITSLNDDCLFEIFKYLSISDLAALKQSHRRLIHVVDEFYTRYCAHVNVNYEVDYDDTANEIKHFGHLVRKISMDFDTIRSDEFECKYVALLKHCTALDALEFVDIHLKDCLMAAIPIQIFGNLSSLKFVHYHCSVRKMKCILNACDPIKLKELFLIDSHLSNVSDHLWGFIAKRMINLEALNFELNVRSTRYATNVMELQKLEKLKELSIECNLQPISPILLVLGLVKSLEQLELFDILLAQNISDAINNLKNLRKLTLTSSCKIPDDFIEGKSNLIIVESQTRSRPRHTRPYNNYTCTFVRRQ